MIYRHFGGNHGSHVSRVVSSGGREFRRDGRMWGLRGLKGQLRSVQRRPQALAAPSSSSGPTLLGRQRYAVVAVAAACFLAVGGCDSHASTQHLPTGTAASNSTDVTSQGASTSVAPSSPTSSDSSPATHGTSPPASSTSADPDGGSATQTYLAYNAWVTHALMYPNDPNVKALAGLASGSAYSEALKNLNSSVVWKGTPATPRVRVISVQYSGTVVKLVDCASPGTLLPYYVSSGKPVPLQKNPVPPPYATSVQVVKLKGHWSVTEANTDGDHTCSP